MKLVYAWIEEYLNIVDQGINFGSQWIYSHQFDAQANSLKFDRQANLNFFPGLFSFGSEGLENVTALVGPNGAGKTNIFEFLGYAVKESSGFGGQLVFEDEAGRIFMKPGDPSETTRSFLRKRKIEPEPISVTATFEFSELRINVPEVVYYSPIYDFRIGTSTEEKWINVSSNFLIQKDGTDRRSSKQDDFNGVAFHRVSEIQRQLTFLSYAKKNDIWQSLTGLTFPKHIVIDFVPFQVPHADNLSEPYNFSISFRAFLKDAFGYNNRNIWGAEVDSITNQEYDEAERLKKTESTTSEQSRLQNIIRWKAFVFALKNVFAAVIRNADSDPGNDLLKYEFVEAIEATAGDTFNEELDYATLPVASQCNFERFLDTFLSNQNILYSESILRLFAETKSLIFSNEVLDWNVYERSCRIKVTLTDVYPLLELYQELLKRHTYITNVPMLWGFIDFEWDGMSSGEIAFLSLFSRLYLAEYFILARTEQTQYEKDQKPYPTSLIILIDEGEQAFHLQWQKQYVSLLIKAIPKLFRANIKIQVVFASHSPITLSDIPKSHIALLRKQASDSLSLVKITDASDLSVNTFASNIYDLLKDSFFLSEGFIGNFAENKINNLITFLRQPDEDNAEQILSYEEDANRGSVEFNADNAKVFIQMIDEPILRQKLWELYFLKFSGFVEEDQLRQEIAKLQARLNLLNRQK